MQGGAQHVEDGIADLGHAVGIVERRLPEPEAQLADVGDLGADDVIDDLVAVPPTAPRALAQRGRRAGDDAVEARPRRVDQGGEPRGLRLGELGAVGRGGLAGRAEVGRGGAREPLDDVEPVAGGLRKGDARGGRDRCVAGGVVGQRVQCALLGLGRPAPTRPIQCAREHLPGPDLEVHPRAHGSFTCFVASSLRGRS